MAHQVETMAYTNEVPWHGLGTRIDKAPTVDKMIKLAGLDWTVERAPMFVDGKEVPGFAALQRSSDKKILDVVGAHYKPVQNVDAFKFFVEFVEAGGATMETAGSLRGGKLVWGLADLKVSFKMKNGNDRVKGYLLVVSPHEQGKSFIIRFTTVRVVCNNTLTLALSYAGQEWRINHRTTFDEVRIDQAKDALGIARDQLGEFERNAKLLQKLNMKAAEIIKVLAPVYQPTHEVKDLLKDNDLLNAKMRAVMGALEHAPGAEPDNAWGVLNAVTYYSDHIASRTTDKRLTNAWLGKTAKQKEVVLASLLERV